jgi:7,8-dihydropterin-6-yl-methyl-4-(beta-D-ribofuranosyl)aminobenzene 5'-phosphate synthase
MCVAALSSASGLAADPEPTKATVRITVVYNNLLHAPARVRTAWGFAAVVETGDTKILFDSGGDSELLLANVRQLGIAPGSISIVVLSHLHRDHTGGIEGFLAKNPTAIVYVPRSVPASFRRSVERPRTQWRVVDGPQRLSGDAYSTGQLGDGIHEQALIVDTPRGLLVITGCAHPGIVELARAARAYLGKDIYLVMGGFHLVGRRPDEITSIIAALRRLGVRKVAPSHCTGDRAIERFRAAWGDDFVDGGCGAVIEVR